MRRVLITTAAITLAGICLTVAWAGPFTADPSPRYRALYGLVNARTGARTLEPTA